MEGDLQDRHDVRLCLTREFYGRHTPCTMQDMMEVKERRA